MYSEESLLETAWSLSSRRTMASVAAAATAVTAASSGQNKRDREIEETNVDDDDADATAAVVTHCAAALVTLNRSHVLTAVDEHCSVTCACGSSSSSSQCSVPGNSVLSALDGLGENGFWAGSHCALDSHVRFIDSLTSRVKVGGKSKE